MRSLAGSEPGLRMNYDGGVRSALLIDGIETDYWRLHVPGRKKTRLIKMSIPTTTYDEVVLMNILYSKC